MLFSKISLKICLSASVLFVLSNSIMAIAQEYDSPWQLYVSVVQTAASRARFNTCFDNAKELCESERDYCLMSEQEKIQYHLQICFEEKMVCLTNCDTVFDNCVALETPLPECSAQRNACDGACDEEGTQCTLDAINGNYETPPAEVCDNQYLTCRDTWYSKCLADSEIPIE